MIITNLSKVYHNKNNDIKALDNINLSFENNGLVIILGSSGSGKTTLLNILTNDIKDYEGTISNVPSISYLNQDVILFESMSVYDNLLTVCDDKKIVDDYLNYFKLINYKNKKVSRLSKGEKRRIQLLCSFLNDKDILLCDEPTSALDFDNSKLVMDMLKELSKNKLVIMVSHDIAISEKYADRIIELKGGKVIKDYNVNKTEKLTQNNSLHKKHFNNHLSFAIKYLMANPFKLILNSLIIFLIIFSLSLMFTSYKGINQKLDYLDTFAKGDNIIVTYNSDKVSTNDKNASELGFNDCSLARHGFSDFYINYDRIPYERIVNVLNQLDDIIGFSVMVDGFEFSRTYEEMYLYEIKNTSFEHLKLPSGGEQLFAPYNSPFIMDKKFPLIKDIYQNKIDNASFDTISYEVSNYYVNNLFKNAINLFYMSDDTIPLSYGNLPKNENEVIIDKNTASKLLKIYSLDDYSELLNKTITLGQYTMAEQYSNINNLVMDNFKMIENNRYILDFNLIPSFDYVISGITDIQNKGMNMIFLNTNILENDILSKFVINDEELTFKSATFLVNPDSDIKEVTSKINDILGLTSTKFVPKSQITSNNVFLERNNESLITYMSVSFVLFIACYIINELLNRAKNKKENKLLKEYNYNYYLVNFIQLIVIFIISSLIIILLSNILVSYLNTLVSNIGYSFIFNTKLSYTLLAILLIFIIICIVNTITRRVR